MSYAQAQKPILNKLQQQIFVTFSNLLTQKEEGTASGLVFFSDASDNCTGGLQLWQKAVEIQGFPVNREATLVRKPEIVKQFSDAVGDVLEDQKRNKGVSIVEIGPGLWESVNMKTCPYIDSLSKTSHNVSEYFSIDPSPKCAISASEGIKGLYPSIENGYYIQSFERLKPISTVGHPLAVLWGPTIWNAGISPGMDPALALSNQIKSVKRLVGGGGLILSTYYGSESKEHDENVYNNPKNLQLVKFLAHKIETELKDVSNFDANNFKPYVEYEGNGVGRFSMGIESTQNQKINLNGTVERDLKKGERIKLVNSWRLKESNLYEICTAADARMIEHTYDKDIKAGMFLAQFNH